jgi:phage host-nuclease inhibitor protein Gam
MKTKRIKVKLPSIASRDEAEAVMNALACTANNQRKFIARRDAEVLAINSKYEANISECAEDLKIKTDALRAWAEGNPDQFPKGRKSIQFVSGTLGFRTGTPKLALLNRSWNWEKALQAVYQWLPAFIRETPEIDKEALLAQRDEQIIVETLPKVGLKVIQDESFFIEPALTDTEARQISEAA